MRNLAILAAAALFVGGAPLGWVSMPIPGPPTLSTGEPAQADLATKVAKSVAQDEERLVQIFKHIHANPELAFREQKTAALVAREFKELGYETHAGIGKTGVVVLGELRGRAVPANAERSLSNTDRGAVTGSQSRLSSVPNTGVGPSKSS